MLFVFYLDVTVSFFIMLQLKKMGLNTDGLRNFYCTCIRSVLVYGAPAWFHLLSQQDQIRLESIQRSATCLMLPDLPYEERLAALRLPHLKDFILHCGHIHFSKIANDSEHPLFSNILFNKQRTSCRRPTKFRTPRCRTHKFKQSFSIFLWTSPILLSFYF